MKQKAGLWIDHRKAVIVNIYDTKVEKLTLESTVERQRGRINGIKSLAPFEDQMVLADDTQEKIFKDHIRKFYNLVCSKIRDAESLLIFGPGEAKIELRKFIDNNFRQKKEIQIAAADRMTEHQITARVLRHFNINKTRG
jgi:stalled ribosome rescue protein Dom34